VGGQRMMLADDLPREAVQALRANRLRSFLTLLGIIIGVATLVGVVSVISGLNVWVQEKVIQLSPDVYIVQKFGIITSRDEFLDALKRPDISYTDYYRVAGLLQKASATAAQVGTQAAVKRGPRRPDRRSSLRPTTSPPRNRARAASRPDPRERVHSGRTRRSSRAGEPRWRAPGSAASGTARCARPRRSASASLRPARARPHRSGSRRAPRSDGSRRSAG